MEHQTPHNSLGEVPTLSSDSKVFKSLSEGVQYFHSKGITHQDISAENVMVTGLNLPECAVGNIITRTPHIHSRLSRLK